MIAITVRWRFVGVGLFAAVFSVSLGLRLAAVTAGEVGNALTPRTVGSDGAIDVFFSNFFAAPYAGQVSGVNIFYQGQAGNFNVYQLRPTGTANQYTVVYASGALIPSGTSGSATTLTFPNGPTNVLPGDIFAHYGNGIAWSSPGQANAKHLTSIFYPSPSAPVVGNNITLPSAGAFPTTAFFRDYSSSVTMSSFVEQVGHGTTNRAFVDSGVGLLGVLTNEPFTKSGMVTKWHIFSDSSAALGRSITPLILRETAAGQYTIIGEGTARTSTAAGLQMFDFGLVSGTDRILPGDLIGWWDGSGVTPNAGVAEADQLTGAPLVPLWVDANGVAAGDVLLASGASFNLSRQYSINFTTTIPEPSTIAIWTIIGLCGAVVGLRRCRAPAR